MRIAVCVKWTLDPEYPFRTGPEGIEDGADIPRMPSPWDMVACEAAVRLKETAGGEVNLFSVGPGEAERALRDGLALGADAGTLIRSDAPEASTRVASMLGAAIAREGHDLVLCSARSPDSGSGLVPAALAQRLGASLVSNVVRIESLPNGGIVVERRLDGGRREVLDVELPAVVGVNPSLCQPRYPTLVARRRAENAPLASLTPADLNVLLPKAALRIVAMRPPRPRNARLVDPPASLNARERIRFILGAGIERRSGTRRLEGAPETIAAEMLEFFRANGLVALD